MISLLLALSLVHGNEALARAPYRRSTELDAPIQASLELGSQATPDPNWMLFNSETDYSRLPTRGLRVGYAFKPWISAIGGWHHGARGSEIEVESSDVAFHSAFVGDEFSLGAKASLPLLTMLQPYATVQAAGLLSTVRFDDDIEDDDNLNQIQDRGFSMGGVAAGGVDFILPLSYGEWALTTNLEFGYGWFGRTEYADMGDLQFKGFHFRWGVGARF